jgi:hypothetical protein
LFSYTPHKKKTKEREMKEKSDLQLKWPNNQAISMMCACFLDDFCPRRMYLLAYACVCLPCHVKEFDAENKELFRRQISSIMTGGRDWKNRT